MTSINRTQLSTIAEALGRAWKALTDPVGDTDRNPAARLRLERALCRLHGSMRFHDFDYTKSAPFLQFGAEDRVGYGMQGGRVVANSSVEALPFPNQSGDWNPALEGPPTLEGWGIWDYNGWKGYQISRPSNNDGPSEPSYNTRFTHTTPVRYSWSGGTYQRVPFWERARWISIKNTTGLNPPSTRRFKITLTASDLEGLRMIDPITDKPKDLRLYSHPYLVQGTSAVVGGIVTWAPLVTTVPYGDDTNSVLRLVDFELTRNSSDYTSWDININVPAYLTSWPNNQWWHIVMYWGSTDSAALSTVTPTTVTTITVADSELIKWERKNFFRKEITDQLAWTSLAVNDKLSSTKSNLWLIDKKRSHFLFNDGEYSELEVPAAYYLEQNWPEATIHGLDNSIIGYLLDIEPGDAVPVRYCSKNRGTVWDNPSSEAKVVVGPPVAPEHWPVNWQDSVYFPPAPDDYETIAKVVYVRAPGAIYGLPEGVDGDEIATTKIFQSEVSGLSSNLLDHFSLLWVEQSAVTFAHPPLDDENLSLTLLPSLAESVLRYRNSNSVVPIIEAAYQLMVPGLRVPTSLAPTRVSLADSNGVASKTFRGLLKKPTATDLKPEVDEKPFAFQLTQPARGVVEDLSGLPPSTELMRLDADKLYLIGNNFRKATKFEVFHEPSDQCSSVDPNASGTKIGLDYRFRWLFEDANENTFKKELNVMSSQYLLTDQEYDTRVAQGLNTTGYYKRGTDAERAARAKGTLETIEEWRLHGYAGILPDLFMGESRVIKTKVVSPPDETKQTEEQFRKNLENQGYTESEIDIKVQEYLDAGGEFYLIDLSQYENDWVAIRSVGISAARYTFATVPYWKNNIWNRFGLPQQNVKEESSPAFNTLRADSFTIAPSNLAIGTLETWGNEAILSLDSALDQSNFSSYSGVEKAFVSNTIGFFLQTTAQSGIGEFAVRLKFVPVAGNTSAKPTNSNPASLKVSLYSNVIDDGINRPGQLITTGGEFAYSNLTNAFQEIRFNLIATLTSGVKYWVVIQKSAAVEGGEIVVDSLGGVLDKMAFLYDALYNTPSSGTWRDNIGQAWLKTFSVAAPTSSTTPLLDNSANTGIEDVFLAKSMAIYLPSAASTTRSFKVRMKFVPFSTNKTGLPSNGASDFIQAYIYSDAGGGIPVTQLAPTGSTIRMDSLTESWQELFFTIDVSALPSTNYWIVLSKTTQAKGGYIVVDKIATPRKIAFTDNAEDWYTDAGDAWFKFYKNSTRMIGAFNRDTQNVLEHLPGPNDHRANLIYKVEGFWAYTCQALDTPGPISIYPRAAKDDSNAWAYIKRSRDIHVCVRYEKGGQVHDYYATLPSARGWHTLWWKRTSGSYKLIDENVAPDKDTIVTQIDYTNYSVDGQSTYLNAKFYGIFRPTENGVYNIRVRTNDAVRLYLDGVLLIDQWPITDPVSEQIHVVASPALSNTQDYEFVVEHYYGTPQNGSDTQRLNVQWAPPSTPSTYSNINDNSEPAPSEVQITSDNVDRIVYVAVGKTLAELQTATHGAPPGDILVVRSS